MIESVNGTLELRVSTKRTLYAKASRDEEIAELSEDQKLERVVVERQIKVTNLDRGSEPIYTLQMPRPQQKRQEIASSSIDRYRWKKNQDDDEEKIFDEAAPKQQSLGH